MARRATRVRVRGYVRRSEPAHRVWPGKLQPICRGECRWCGAAILKRDGTANLRRTFCGPKCIKQFKLRSDWRFMRRHVFARDRGRCGECGLAHEWKGRWQADHIVPLFAANGDWTCWDPDNVQVLCTKPCHTRKTARDMIRYARFLKRNKGLPVQKPDTAIKNSCKTTPATRSSRSRRSPRPSGPRCRAAPAAASRPSRSAGS